MPTFALEKIKAVVGKQEFVKLIIDGKCPFDEFEANVDKRYRPEIASLYSYMNDVSNLRSLPEQKFHPYDNGTPREYEFKTKHLRVYCIEMPNGKLVILGGTKAKQKTDQSLFRKYKNQYIQWLNKKDKK